MFTFRCRTLYFILLLLLFHANQLMDDTIVLQWNWRERKKKYCGGEKGCSANKNAISWCLSKKYGHKWNPICENEEKIQQQQQKKRKA